MAYTTVARVALELGVPTPAAGSTQAQQWAGWIDRVEASIARRFARAGLDLAQQITAGDPTQDALASVVAAVVARHVRVEKLEGLTSTTVSVDDGSVTKRREGAAAGDGASLALTDAEWDEIMPTIQSDAFSSPIRYVPGW